MDENTTYQNIARAAKAVTKSDSTVYENPTMGVYVGTTGDVNVVMRTGNTVLFKAVPAGMFLPISVTKILSTSTTASDFVLLWED